MNNPYESRDWHIVVSVRWKLKPDVITHIKCERCNGSGQFSSWGADPNDDLTCNVCWGSGKVPNPEIEDKPRMPEVFRNYIRGYYHKFFNDMDKRREENEQK